MKRHSRRTAVSPLIRTITYASLFIAVVLVFLPLKVLQWSGIGAPVEFGASQAAGALLVLLGAAVALWCVFAFAIVGKGTPAPFDPPRSLVIRGPYRFVRNPMYIGAGTALAGAALFYVSPALLGFTALFFIITHLFVVIYEEPALRRTFGAEYDEYRKKAGRWFPRLKRG
jgi:protein-S-isoprenylcysteine O-methyltransferase Ste14